jgi:hypothetical protein
MQWGCWATDRVKGWAAANHVKAGEDGEGWALDLPHQLYRHFWKALWAELSIKLQAGRLAPIVWEDAVFEAPGLWAELAGGEADGDLGGKLSPVVELYKRPKWDRLSVLNTVRDRARRALLRYVDSGRQEPRQGARLARMILTVALLVHAWSVRRFAPRPCRQRWGCGRSSPTSTAGPLADTIPPALLTVML